MYIALMDTKKKHERVIGRGDSATWEGRGKKMEKNKGARGKEYKRRGKEDGELDSWFDKH